MPKNPGRTSLSGFDEILYKLIGNISFIAAAAACLTPPRRLNIMGLKNKEIYSMWIQKGR